MSHSSWTAAAAAFLASSGRTAACMAQGLGTSHTARWRGQEPRQILMLLQGDVRGAGAAV
jgi:hypothetical protein